MWLKWVLIQPRPLALLISQMGLLKTTAGAGPWDGGTWAGTFCQRECTAIAGLYAPCPHGWPQPHPNRRGERWRGVSLAAMPVRGPCYVLSERHKSLFVRLKLKFRQQKPVLGTVKNGFSNIQNRFRKFENRFCSFSDFWPLKPNNWFCHAQTHFSKCALRTHFRKTGFRSPGNRFLYEQKLRE